MLTSDANKRKSRRISKPGEINLEEDNRSNNRNDRFKGKKPRSEKI